MADLLTDALPTVWEGRRIDPDFRHMVRLLNGFLRAGSDDDKLTLLRQAAAVIKHRVKRAAALVREADKLRQVRGAYGGAEVEVA